MKKSLFSKLMSTYFIIIVISYILVAVFLSIWFYEYYYEDKKATLLKEATNIQTIVKDYSNRKISKTDMNLQLAVTDRVLNTKITIYNNYGDVIAHSGSLDNRKEINNNETKEDFDEVMKGDTVVTTGDFKQVFKSYVMTVGMPIKINDGITYSVFLNSSLDQVKQALGTVYFVIWMAAFFAIIISAFIVYYFSEKILINPLSRINHTAKQISKGEFDNRVDIVSNDEIGDLAVSFNYMADSLQNLENMRKSFIANVSHELRSPMTSINGFVEGMLDGTIPEEKWGRYLRVVDGESKRLILIINDLLDLARLESGEFSMKMGVFDINELIGECVVKFEERISRKNINMKITLIKNISKVKGDRDRINQVITNLVDNAIKFVPENGTIEVKVKARDNKILVSVFNTGNPIPKEEIKYIWERFHKVDKARSKGGGTGLGLSIIRQILNQHNETVWVESNPYGNKFIFTLTQSDPK